MFNSRMNTVKFYFKKMFNGLKDKSFFSLKKKTNWKLYGFIGEQCTVGHCGGQRGSGAEWPSIAFSNDICQTVCLFVSLSSLQSALHCI